LYPRHSASTILLVLLRPATALLPSPSQPRSQRRNLEATVKEFSKKLLLELHPSDFDVLFTHPMFRLESAPNGWTGLSYVFENVRIFDEEQRVSRGEN
ncbi:hypothetical protein S245_056386, partial [Arachis hypogaea]